MPQDESGIGRHIRFAPLPRCTKATDRGFDKDRLPLSIHQYLKQHRKASKDSSGKSRVYVALRRLATLPHPIAIRGSSQQTEQTLRQRLLAGFDKSFLHKLDL